MSGTVLKLHDLCCSFAGLRVLAGMNLMVGEGSMVGLVGSNGAGKTTLLNAINGFDRPDRGSIHLRGREISSLPVYLRAACGIGRVFQESRIWPGWTVREHMAVAIDAFGNRKTAFDRILEIVAMRDELLEKHADELTLFERRQMELALAALAGSSVLLVDEIAAGLNLEESRSLYDRITQFVRAGECRAAVMVEHKLDLLGSYATEICLLDGGRLAKHAYSSDPESVAELMRRLLKPGREVQ